MNLSKYLTIGLLCLYFLSYSNDCKERKISFEKKLERNKEKMNISPSDLIVSYNKLFNCEFSPEFNANTKELLKDFKFIDSVYCNFLLLDNCSMESENKLDSLIVKYQSSKFNKLFLNYHNSICNNIEKKVKIVADCKEEKNDSTDIDKEELVPVKISLKPKGENVSFNEIIFLDEPKLFLTQDSSIYFEFCFINKGSFNIGITSSQYQKVLMEAGDKAFDLNIQDEVSKKDSRYVSIDQPYYISKFELSEAQMNLLLYDSIAIDYSSKSASNISNVNLDLILQKLNTIYANLTFDIPTEAQWEFAAKGSSEKLYVSSNDFFDIDHQVIVNDSTGIKEIMRDTMLCSWVNSCDMIGNVKEVCYANHEYYMTTFNTHSEFVARGGSYLEDQFGARTTSRHPKSNIKVRDTGIRLIIKKK